MPMSCTIDLYQCFGGSSAISKPVRKFTGTGLITGSGWNGPIFFLLPADISVILIQYTCTD